MTAINFRRATYISWTQLLIGSRVPTNKVILQETIWVRAKGFNNKPFLAEQKSDQKDW